MKSDELRQKFLDFFEKKGHKIIPSASLVPENDPTVLFTTAGMHPLVPFLLGENHPEGKRLANVQKCIRTGDIDEVGDDTHLTFFEMIGNWSLGDPASPDGVGQGGYWKEEAIKWSFEFLTKELGIPVEKLSISCFAGDKDAPKDKESAKIWEELGVKKQRIAFLGKQDNWWGPAGQTGPCGPDTEMFYWKLNTPAPETFDSEDKNWVEIWNDVFMQYVKTADGKFTEAEQKNVDTGMGLERMLSCLNGSENIYHTDVFEKPHKKLHELLKEENSTAERIILDHLRASTFILAEQIEPSNVERGYVLRRLIRRAIRYGRQIGVEGKFCSEIAKAVIESMGEVYPETKENKDFIVRQLKAEEQKFERTLENGLKAIKELFKKEGYLNTFALNDDILFDLYQTHGFPVELSLEEIGRERKSRGLPAMDSKRYLERFNESAKKHQELSRTASAGVFKGGLADSSEQTTKLHTAAHLLLAGLRKVLGEHVVQKGSNITAERLRFDFSHKEKMTPQQVKDAENFVNGIIKKDLPVWFEEMTLEKAKEINAMGVFESKYGKMVKVYFVGKWPENVSCEICGGPHVERSGTLGHFRITKQGSSSAGVRRIKAVLE